MASLRSSEATSDSWRARPVAARALQLVVLAVPIAASVGCAALVSNALPHARHVGPALGWWAIVLACSTVTLFAVDRVARRLLPLALLLRLSLVFPDQAPKRMRVAARSWSSRRLREQLKHDSTTDATTAPIDAAGYLLSLLASLAAHDRRTRGHCERVRAYNDLLAEELGLSDADRDRLRWAALIHDIGKLDVPRRILNKAGKPTESEWEELHAHPMRGAEIAAPLNEWLGPWALAISQHHEHWDGTGYPQGLSGTDISLGARIVGVADAFEVMTSPRPYSKPMNAAAARQELAACAGTHFDPQVVRALFNVSLGRLRLSMGPVAWFAQVPVLAAMPRLSAALIQGGQLAAVSAGSAIGVVAVSAAPAAASHAEVHAAVHRHPASVVAQTAPVGPLAAALTVTGQTVDPTSTALPHRGAVAVRHHRHGKASHHATSARARGKGQSSAHGRGRAARHALPATSAGSTHGQRTASAKRHHGQAHTTATRSSTSRTTQAAQQQAKRARQAARRAARRAARQRAQQTTTPSVAVTPAPVACSHERSASLPPGLARCG